MDKFIIELPDNTAWLQWVKVVEDGTVYFDYKYPEDLTPYTEPDLDAIRKEVHDKCMSEAEDLAYKIYSPKIDKAYQRGLNDAWEAARKIWEYDTTTLKAIFGEGVMRMDWFMKFTASECIEKIRQYEQEKGEQIQVGDEVENTQTGVKFIVTHIWFNNHGEKGVSGFNHNCSAFSATIELVKKTGRYFPEIAEVLQKMKEN